MSSNAKFWVVSGAFFALNALGLNLIYREARRPVPAPDAKRIGSIAAAPTADSAPAVPEAAREAAPASATGLAAANPPGAESSAGPAAQTKRLIKWAQSNQNGPWGRLMFSVEPAVPDSVQIGTPLDVSPLHIPNIPSGRWIWGNRGSLLYNLKEPLPGGRRYTVELSPDAEKILGGPVSLLTPSVIETSPLLLRGRNLEEIDLTTVRASLRFSEDIRPEDLKAALTVKIGAESVPFRVVNNSKSSLLMVDLDKREGATAEFRIDESLKAEGADFGFKAPQIFSLNMPQKFAVTNAVPESAESGSRSLRTTTPWQTVRINFNKRLDPNQKSPVIKAEPEIPNLQVGLAGAQLTLSGDIEVNRRYTLTIAPETVAFTGERLEGRNTATVLLPPPPPGVEFAQSDGILSPQGDMAVEVRAVGTPKIKLQTWKLVPANLVAFLQDRRRYWWEDSYDYYECYDCEGGPVATPPPANGVAWFDETRERPSQKNAVPVFSKTYAITANKTLPTTHALDLRKIFGDNARGVYRLRVNLENGYYYSYSGNDFLTVAISDLALSAKRAREETLVWVNSISGGAPEAGVEVQALSYFNQVIATATTDAQGLARLPTSYESLEKDPYVLVARKGEDLNYLLPEQGRWRVEDIDLAGAPVPVNYEAALYPERGVYRPGEVIQASGIIRDADGLTPEPFPLLLSLVRSDGKVLARQTTLPIADVSGQGQGFFHTSLIVPDDAWTGTYKLTAEIPGDKKPIATTKTLVEEFSPVRLAVEASPTSDTLAGSVEVRDVGAVPLITSAAPKFSILAKYLFGSPAGKSPVKLSGEFTRAAISPPALRDFVLDGAGSNDRQSAEAIEGELDAEGRAVLSLGPPAALPKAHWAARFTATVRDKGGRSVSKNLEFRYDNAGRHIGARLNGQIFRPGEPIQIEWTQVDVNGNPVAPAATLVRLEKVYWDYYYASRDDGRVRWESRLLTRDVSARRFDPPADGASRGVIEVSAPDYGQHKIHVIDVSTSATATLDVWVGWGGDAEKIALGRPERLEIALDKRAYNPGDNAVALIRSPFPGRALLSIETDEVLESRALELGAGSTSVTLPVTPGRMRAGAYLSASVVRPLDPTATSWQPRRALGVEHLAIDPEFYSLPVVIYSPENVQPGETFEVVASVPPDSIQGAAPAEIHLWAVDEGILLTTDYTAPDPIKTFYSKRRAEIYSADNYNDLLPDYARPESMERIGASDDGEGGRGAGVVLKDRREGVIWRIAAPVDAEGKLRATITAPEFVGKIRLMAVAARGDHFGRAERGVTISQPLMIEVSSPRFTAPGDEFDLPVKIFNTTDQPVQARIGQAVQGPVELEIKEAELSLEIAANSTHLLMARARATGFGPAHVEFNAAYTTSEGAVTSRAKADFPSRPTFKPLVESAAARVEAGNEAEFTLSASFMPGSAERIIRISPRPELELAPALADLIDYPWGCLEQVSSRMLGMIRAPETLSRITKDDPRIGEASTYIQIGIYRLASFQTQDGGLSYWGGGESSFWPTIYAARLLLQAREAGFEVPASMMKGVSDYLAGAFREGSAGGGPVSDNELAEALFVMSAMGKANEGWLNSVSESADKMDLEGRSYLARAWLAAGRRERAISVLPGENWEKMIPARTLGGRIVSRVTQLSAFLECLLDFDPKHPLAPEVAAKIDRERVHGVWGVTRNNAAAVSALCRYYGTSSASPEFKGEIALGGERREFDSSETRQFILGRSDEPIRIKTSGSGSVYVSLTDKGAPKSGALPERDVQIKARRRWLDAKGDEITTRTLNVGELVWAEVTLTARDRYARIPNVAIEDALPGCLEAENPKFSTSALAVSPVANPSQPDRIEYRDDRVAIFATAVDTASRFTYPARVVRAGRFAAPPIHAECMYDPEIVSIHQGSRTTMEAQGQ